MDGVHVMFWALGILVLVGGTWGVVKAAKEGDLLPAVIWPVILGLAALIWFGFLDK